MFDDLEAEGKRLQSQMAELHRDMEVLKEDRKGIRVTETPSESDCDDDEDLFEDPVGQVEVRIQRGLSFSDS